MPAIVQTAPVFLQDFLQKAQAAQNKVLIQSMVFETGEMMEKLAPILAAKAQEGVDVQLEIDWVSRRFIHGHLPLLPVLSSEERQYNRLLHTKNWQVREELMSKGVKITEINQASLISQFLPMFRRNHVKLFIVDDKFGWVGGVNLLDRAFSCQDFMVRFDQIDEIKTLEEQFFRVNANRPRQNLENRLNKTDILLTDAGKIANSIIYRRALELINTAKSDLCFVSQFVPEGQVRDALMSASARGVNVEIVNSFSAAKAKWSAAHKAAYRAFLFQLRRHPSISFRHSTERIHAKLLIADSQTALFGSHNLVDTGVLMGTEEIAVHTSDPDLVVQLVEFKNALT
jgi:phosphatidylserine/phosphatidylglycerophosphate/cardiolipin synthase-like enzyme